MPFQYPARFSIIDYLNALPLNMAFKDGRYRDRAELVFDFPSQCADNLAAGRADVGLISSIEYQRIPGLVIAPHIAIAGRQEVRSVLILTKKDLRDVRQVALDRFSRSSVALLRILLHRRHGSRPHFISMTPDPNSMLRDADAALIIGDAALAMSPGDYQVIDLATEWYRETQLPFVFAFWAMRPEVPQADIADMLLAAKHYGLEQLPHRIDEIRARWDLPPEEILAYLTTNIHYDLEEKERASLARFYRYAYEARLIDHVEAGRFAESSSS
ncbi:MAG: menaquinone biosynthesis protein [Acidobacteriota bacterium]|nr:menaquinone biosynthesis protein [Acidobacteriota bacterium]